MSAPGCIGGPCKKFPNGACNGPSGTASCGRCDPAGWTEAFYLANVARVDGPCGLAFVTGRGREFTFTFDKIEGYRGEPAKEIGLVRGATVYIETDGDVVIRVRTPHSQGGDS